MWEKLRISCAWVKSSNRASEAFTVFNLKKKVINIYISALRLYINTRGAWIESYVLTRILYIMHIVIYFCALKLNIYIYTRGACRLKVMCRWTNTHFIHNACNYKCLCFILYIYSWSVTWRSCLVVTWMSHLNEL